jgi:hypothetical protein
MIQRTIRLVLAVRQRKGGEDVSGENEAILVKYETGPTHAQLVRMTLRRG